MARIPTTNIGMNLLQNEYGGNNPISMSEYYRSANSNNGQLVDYSKPTAGGYLGAVSRAYAPGTNNSSGQNTTYRKQTYVNRYSYNSLFGADAGEPIGNPWVAGEPSPRMTRYWIWNGVTVLTEQPYNSSTTNGPNTNNPTGYLGSTGSTLTSYYTPNSYIYVNGYSGSLWASGNGGCQNPSPSNIQVNYPYSSVGPKTGVQYGPLTGGFGLYGMLSNVFYGLISNNLYYTAPGTQYLNTTVPQISFVAGPISLGDFKNQEN